MSIIVDVLENYRSFIRRLTIAANLDGENATDERKWNVAVVSGNLKIT